MGKTKIRKTTITKRITKRTPVGEIILKYIPPSKKPRKRLTPRQQINIANDLRKHNKYHYLHNDLLSKETKKLYTYVKKHKSVVARKYNTDLEKMMKDKGYFYSQIVQARRYSLVGKKVRTKVAVIVKRYNKNNTKGLVKGKWIGIKKVRSLEKRTIKAARIRSYMDILGISKEKAKEVYKEIEKKTQLSFEFKALIY
jgi:hypothetical protein